MCMHVRVCLSVCAYVCVHLPVVHAHICLSIPKSMLDVHAIFQLYVMIFCYSSTEYQFDANIFVG